MNKTFGDLMGEYRNAREEAWRFSSWGHLDKWVEELVQQVSPKVEKPVMSTYKEYHFDANGTPISQE